MKNVIERLIIRNRARSITRDDLPREISRSVQAAAQPAQEPHSAVVSTAYQRMVEGGESFWPVVYQPFMTRDLTRDDLRLIVRQGLEETRGDYKILVQLFNMPPKDYKRFLNFLHKYDCHLPLHALRPVPAKAKMKMGPRSAMANRRESLSEA